MVLRILNALFSDLTRLAYIGVLLILAVALTAFTAGMLASLLWKMIITGWLFV